MSTRCITIVVLLVVTGVFAHLSNKPLSGGPERIVALELAPSVVRADEFLTTWQRSDPAHWQEKLLQSLDWDTWLILSYTPLFALLCWSAARSLHASHPRLRAWGVALAASQLLAGALDFVENFGMRQMILAGAARPPWPLITSSSSGVKWLLILMFVAFGIGVLAHRLRTSDHSVSELFERLVEKIKQLNRVGKLDSVSRDE